MRQDVRPQAPAQGTAFELFRSLGPRPQGHWAFARELTEVCGKLSGCNIRVTISVVTILHVVEPLAMAALEQAAGLSGSVTRLEAGRYGVISLRDGARDLGRRLRCQLDEILGRGADRPVIEVRQVSYWAAANADADYLLAQLMEEPAQPLVAA